MIKYLTLLLFISSTLFSSVIINNGDVIQVEKCNKYHWCKVTSNKYYVKGHNFYKLKTKKGTVALMFLDKDTHFYIRNKDVKNNHKLWEYIKKEVSTSTVKVKNNFIYGYTKVTMIKEFAKLNKKPEIKESLVANQENMKTNDKKVIEAKKIVETKKIEKVMEDKKSISKYFITAGLGYSHVNIDNTVPKVDLQNGTLDKTAFNIDLGLGYNYNERVFTTVNISRARFSILDITNFYLSANYVISKNNFNPYIGALFGMGNVKYKSNPILNTSVNKNSASNYIYGLQFGVSQKISNKFYIIAQYQILNQNHHTNINDTYSIDYDMRNNILLGVKYDF